MRYGRGYHQLSAIADARLETDLTITLTAADPISSVRVTAPKHSLQKHARRSVTRPTSCPTLTDVPSGSVISTPCPRASPHPTRSPRMARAYFVLSLFAGPLMVRAGRNAGGGSGIRTRRLTWLRQFHSRPPPDLVPPDNLGKCLNQAAAAKVSATIRSFSSALQRHSCSTSVMIFGSACCPTDLSVRCVSVSV